MSRYLHTKPGTGVLIGGTAYEVPGIDVVNCRDNPRYALKLGEDGYRKAFRRVDLLVLHTTTGAGPQGVLPGRGPPGDLAERNAICWNTHKDKAAAHLLVDLDGQCLCTGDLLDEVAYGSGASNGPAIQIEICARQFGGRHLLYEEQLATAVDLVRNLCTVFFIPQIVQWPYAGKAVPRLARGAKGVRGVIGHRDCSNDRSRFDPGDAVYERLIKAGFEAVDFGAKP